MSYLGVDFGTSGARAILIDPDGAVLWEQSRPFPPSAPQDWPQMWRETLLALLTALPPALKPGLQKICLNGTSATVLLADARGALLTEPLLYNDGRGRSVLPRLASLAPAGHLVHSAASSLAKLLWWSEQSYFPQAQYFFHQADWLGFLLHGEPGISDYHNALKLGYDVVNLRYPPWLEDSFLRPLLPKVLTPGAVIGPLKPDLAQTLGLSPACLIGAGTTDSIAAFLASGASEPGEAVTSLGSTLALKLLSRRPVEDLASGVYSHRLGDLWLAGGASNCGGAVLRQFFSDEQLRELSADIDPTRPCPYDYYPLPQTGERFPVNDPQKAPRLTPRPENPADFLWGLLVGLSRVEAQGYQKLQSLGASPLVRVYSAGGGAQNSVWRRLREQTLGVPVLLSPQAQGAYGSALLARSGGRYN
ncbi:MAG: carbohydrate kinase [Cyanobacteria bacterium RI_101]|nr:carbohydrate kinase [Cyanobacteria bacterium RI_101]